MYCGKLKVLEQCYINRAKQWNGKILMCLVYCTVIKTVKHGPGGSKTRLQHCILGCTA